MAILIKQICGKKLPFTDSSIDTSKGPPISYTEDEA